MIKAQKPSPLIPQTPVLRLSRPFLHFMKIESSGGILLVFCTVLALILANSSLAEAYAALWEIPIGLQFGAFSLSRSLSHWINDGLMTIFFFVVGLEIKRELLLGELQDKKAVALPIVAALGGMIVPALIYFLLVTDYPARQGWGIPMATDIAFVVGFLALLGSRVPQGLKIFLLSLAIVDDIGAVVVIGVFYNSEISVLALLAACLGFIMVILLNRIGVRRITVYAVVGSSIWLAFMFSGIHPTISGVLLGLLTPASAWFGDKSLSEVVDMWHSHVKEAALNPHIINDLLWHARETVSPLERLEIALHPWVGFVIMPLFALANAGIPLSMNAFFSTTALGIAASLMIGKVVGVTLFTLLTVKLMGSQLPGQTNWSVIIGAGLLAGVGFTMSIFIASLAFEGELLINAKAGIFLGSTVCALLGLGSLMISLHSRQKTSLLGDN